jgi:hypothetical protein
MREGGGYVAANSRLVEVTLWMHRSDAAVKRIVCRRHVSTYTSYSRELLPVQQAGSYSRLLPRATPGATSRELLPTTPESYSRCNKPGATPDYSRELLQQAGSHSVNRE